MFLLHTGYIFLSCHLYYRVVGSQTLSSKQPQRTMIRIQLTTATLKGILQIWAYHLSQHHFDDVTRVI